LQPNRNDFSCFKILIEGKENCDRKETDIHALLDSLDVFKINIKEFLQDQARVDFLKLRRLSQSKEAVQTHSCAMMAQYKILVLRRLFYKKDYECKKWPLT